MERLLNLLSSSSEAIVTGQILYDFFNKDLVLMHKLIGQNIIVDVGIQESVFCSECGDEREISYGRDNKPQYICGCSGKHCVPFEHLKDYKFNLPLFVSEIAKSFSQLQPEKIDDRHWYLAEIMLQNLSFEIYFYLHQDYSKDLKLHYNDKLKLIFYLGDNQVIKNKYFLVHLPSVFNLGNGPLSVDLRFVENFISNNYKNVSFEDGILQLHGQSICSLREGTVQYYFLEYLYNNFDSWMKKDEILAHIKSQMCIYNNQPVYRISREDNLCADALKKIKTASKNNNPCIPTIILNKRGSYRLTNPT